MTMRVGIPQSGYNVDRNIVASLPGGAQRLRPFDRNRIRAAVRYRVGLPTRLVDLFTFQSPYWGQPDLFHFFNSVASVRTPWVTTFEGQLPRWHDSSPARIVTGMQWLLSPSCRRLIAFSQAARNNAVNHWSEHLPARDVEALESKTIVLLPPQRLLVADGERPADVITTFVFAGRDFYRKGGLLCLEAFARVAEKEPDGWRAHFVGNLDAFGDHASRTERQDRQRALELIERLSPRVTQVSTMRNADLISLLRGAHYYLMPTYDDTFGYSVLEAGACGCIPIVTNVRSLPEVVDKENGFVIELPLDRNREAHTVATRSQLDSLIVDQLCATLESCLSESAATRRLRLERIRARLVERHDPLQHARVIGDIYHDAIGR